MPDCAFLSMYCFTDVEGHERLNAAHASQWKDVLPMNSIPSSSAAPFKMGEHEEREGGEWANREREREREKRI